MDVKDNPHLIGRIALEAGFITPAQLDECLSLQASAAGAHPLGELLVKAGYLTEAQFAEVRRLQDSRFERLEADPTRGGLFGQLAVRLGYLSPADLHQALRAQESARRGGSSLLLGQLLLREKRLTADQFLELMRRQKKDVASCPACHAFYDVAGHDSGPLVCPSCRKVLRQQPVSS